MKVEAVKLWVLRLPLVTPFRTSQHSDDERAALLVCAHTTEGAGWADCAVSPGPFYEPEFLSGTRAVMAEYLVPMLTAAPAVTAARVQAVLAPVKGHQMAKAALETAVLDAELRAKHMSFATYLGAVRDGVPAGVSVGIPGSAAELIAQVEGYLEQGYRRVKLKIEPGWDIEPIAAVRERFGPGLALQADANTAYTLASASRLRDLKPQAGAQLFLTLPADRSPSGFTPGQPPSVTRITARTDARTAVRHALRLSADQDAWHPEPNILRGSFSGLAAIVPARRPGREARAESSLQANGVAGAEAGRPPLPCSPCCAGRSTGQVQDGVGVLGGLGQYGDRLCRGQDDQVDLAAAGLLVDVVHHRQGALRAGADHQPTAPPGDVLGRRQRGVAVGAAELAGGGLLALADLPAVDDQVVVIGHAVDAHRTE